MTVVVDASTVVAALIDSGTHGDWAEQILRGRRLAAPHGMPAEVSNVLRRAERVGDLSSDVAAIAHSDLAALHVDLFPFGPFSERVWELRHAVTAYDAWYVALAEAAEAPLATLDRRLAAADGPACEFLIPSQ